jgi:hypothetical protein
MQSAEQKSCHLVCYSHWRNLPICGPLHHTYSRWCSLSSGWCTRMNLPIHRNPVFCYRPNAKQNNELPLGIDHVLRTLIFHWGYVNFYTYFSKKKIIHTMSRWRQRISKFGECPSMAARTSNLGVMHHSPRDRVFRFLKSVHDFNSLVSSTCTLYKCIVHCIRNIQPSKLIFLPQPPEKWMTTLYFIWQYFNVG